MKAISKKVMAVLLLLSSLSAYAALPNKTICDGPSVRIGFSNGVLTNYQHAVANARKLADRGATLNPRIVSKADKGYVVFYHENNGTADFAEVFLQKQREAKYNGITFSAKAGAYFLRFVNFQSSVSPLYVEMAQIGKERFSQYIAQASTRVDTAVIKDLKLVQDILKHGDSLIIIAHSQGNLYSNAMLSQLYTSMPASVVSSKVALIGAGVPSNKMVGEGGALVSGNYVTNIADIVIEGLRAIPGFLSPLPGNETAVTTTDLLGHGFEKVYFNESHDTGRKLIGHIVYYAGRLVLDLTTTSKATDVAFTFTTTLTYPVSLDPLFMGSTEAIVQQSGPFAGSFNSRAISRTDNSMIFETEVTCELLNRLPDLQEHPLTVSIALSQEAGTPIASDIFLRTAGYTTEVDYGKWRYRPSVFYNERINFQNSTFIAVSAPSAYALKLSGQNAGIRIRPSSEAIYIDPSVPR